MRYYNFIRRQEPMIWDGWHRVCVSISDMEALQNVERFLCFFKTLFCFVFFRTILQLECFTHVLRLIWRIQVVYLFLTNCLLSTPATWMSFSRNKPKKKSIYSLLFKLDQLWIPLYAGRFYGHPFLKLTVVQEICVNFTNWNFIY